MGFLYDWWEERLEIQCIAAVPWLCFRGIIMSLEGISMNVNLGWFIKSIHRWSGAVMVLFLVLHITRVYLTGALMKPRELIWITGIMVAFGLRLWLSGYSLAWDQVAFWG